MTTDKQVVEATLVTILDIQEYRGEMVQLEVWYDPEANAVFGVEADYLDQVTDVVLSPYNNTYLLRLSEIKVEEHKRDKKSREDSADGETDSGPNEV